VRSVRALVTGGAGFIGSWLVERMLARGDIVTVVDDLSTGSLSNLAAARAVNLQRAGAFTFVRADITADGLEGIVAAARPDLVHHLAAQMDVRVSVRDPLFDLRTNVLGTVAVLEASARAGVKMLTFASSGGTIYGSPARQPVSERAGLDPLSPYAAGKAAVESYLRAYRGLYGLDSTVLALGNVYGPRQSPHGEAGVVAIFAGELLAGRQGTIFGDGTSIRDYVHVDDVVDAFVLAGGDGLRPPPAPGRRLNVASGAGTTVRDLHALVATAAGAEDRPTFAPARPGELAAITLEVRAARQVGWVPRTPLAGGVRGTVEWVRDRLG
jgi:UDP-glucose 4-epimerase